MRFIIDFFNVISLFGGLPMFLYGMRLMGDALKENSSGTLKRAMGKVTNNPVKVFFLGLLVTAVIQSSTATIVIPTGLVGAGVLTLHQSVGVIIGANVGTTVTGSSYVFWILIPQLPAFFVSSSHLRLLPWHCPSVLR